MVSALVSVGLGHTSKEDLQEVLDSRNNDHVKARNTAPPSGLYLVEVSYNERGKFKELELNYMYNKPF